MVKLFFNTCILLMLSNSIYAATPQFSVPSKEFLQLNGFFTPCDAKTVKILDDRRINIKGNFCKTFCPDDWLWKIKNSSTCFELSKVKFQALKITYVKNNDGSTNYSMIDATFSDDSKVVFKLHFQTKVNDFWYCIRSMDNTIQCVNDT